MSELWTWVGNCVPATWGVEGFIRISNAASLADVSREIYCPHGSSPRPTWCWHMP